MALLQGRLASGEDIFGPLIRKYLLDNKHRVSVEMLPDKDLAAQREAAERDRLATVRSAMGPEDIEAVIRETRELKERQVSARSCRCSMRTVCYRPHTQAPHSRATPDSLVCTPVCFKEMLVYAVGGRRLHRGSSQQCVCRQRAEPGKEV